MSKKNSNQAVTTEKKTVNKKVIILSKIIVIAITIIPILVIATLFWSIAKDPADFVASIFDYHYDDDYKLEETSSISVCKDGGEILSTIYWTGLGDDKNEFVYYKTGDNKIISLNTSIGEKIIEKNPEWNLQEYKNNSTRSDFPALEFMQDKIEYEVIDWESFFIESKTARKDRYKLNSTSVQDYRSKYGIDHFYENNFDTFGVTYINPENVTKEEFDIIVGCAKEIKKNPRINISILVYQKPNTKLLKQITYYNSFQTVFTELTCVNEGFVVIQDNGVVVSGYYKKDSSGNYNIAEKIYIGYYDLNGEFVREKEIDNGFNYRNVENPKFIDDLKEVGFPAAYQNSQTLKLLFNENQEPVDDYLKTCKNQEGKTIFDIFKEG